MKTVQNIDEIIKTARSIKDTPLHHGYRQFLNSQADHIVKKAEELKERFKGTPFWE